MPNYYMNSDVERWIEKHRIPNVGLLDMKAMAKLFNIEIVIKDIKGAKGYLLENKPPRKYVFTITLDSKSSYTEKLFTFAHEIGHMFTWEVLGWSRKYFSDEGKQAYTELFCDWFARELLLPRRWLNKTPFGDLFEANIAISDLCVDEETFLLQRMARGDISPQFIKPDKEIICLYCCDFEYYRRSCSCKTQREEIRKAAYLQKSSQLALPLVFKNKNTLY